MMELDWDAAKAAANLRKHRVAFEDAALVFTTSEELKSTTAARSTVKIAGSPSAPLGRFFWLWCIPSEAMKPSA
jgi:hypothetical protein